MEERLGSECEVTDAFGGTGTYTFEVLYYHHDKRSARSVESALKMFSSSFAPLLLADGQTDMMELVCKSMNTVTDDEDEGYDFSTHRAPLAPIWHTSTVCLGTIRQGGGDRQPLHT